jgi:hypothetical protein
MKQYSKARSAGAGLIAIAAVATFAGVAGAKGGVPAPPAAPVVAPPVVAPPVVPVRPPDARQGAVIPAHCASGAAGHVGFNKSGSRVTLEVGVVGGVAAPGWHITVTDTVNGVVAKADVADTADVWSALVNFQSPKGNRTIDVTFAAIDGSDSCSGSLSYKA